MNESNEKIFIIGVIIIACLFFIGTAILTALGK